MQSVRPVGITVTFGRAVTAPMRNIARTLIAIAMMATIVRETHETKESNLKDFPTRMIMPRRKKILFMIVPLFARAEYHLVYKGTDPDFAAFRIELYTDMSLRSLQDYIYFWIYGLET